MALVVLSAEDETKASVALEPLKNAVKEEVDTAAQEKNLYVVWNDSGIASFASLDVSIASRIDKMRGVSGLMLREAFPALSTQERFIEQHRRFLASQARITKAKLELVEQQRTLDAARARAKTAIDKVDTLVTQYSEAQGIDAREILEMIDTVKTELATTNKQTGTLWARVSYFFARGRPTVLPVALPDRWSAREARSGWLTAINHFVEANTFDATEVPVTKDDASSVRTSGQGLTLFPVFMLASFQLIPYVLYLQQLGEKRYEWRDAQAGAGPEELAQLKRTPLLYATVAALLRESAKIPRSVWFEDENRAKLDEISTFFADVIAFDYNWFVREAGAGTAANAYGFTSQAESFRRTPRLQEASETRAWISETFVGPDFDDLREAALREQPDP